MAEIPYLWIYNNKEDQDPNTSGTQLPSEQIGNLYVKGDIIKGGESIFNAYQNEKQKLVNIFGKAQKLPAGADANANWSVEDLSAELWGTHLCLQFTMKPKKTFTVDALSKANTKVCNLTVTHYGYIKGISHVSFSNESSGPVCGFYTHGNGVEGQQLKLGITLSSVGSDLKQGLSVNANFSIPVALNYNKFAEQENYYELY